MLTTDDRIEIDTLVDKVLLSIGTEIEMPPKLYHYTSPSGLLGIIESGRLRATNVEYLNDQNELHHAIRVFLDELRGMASIETHVSRKEWLEYAYREVDKSKYNLVSMSFVTCFSTLADDLSQWRGYGDGEGGISIGFDTLEVSKRIGKYGAILVPVVYSHTEQQKIVRFVLSWAAARISDRVNEIEDTKRAEFVTAWSGYLSDKLEVIALTFKSPAFKAESEWRIIYPMRKIGEISVKPKKGHLSLCIDFDMTVPTELTDWQRTWALENRTSFSNFMRADGKELSLLPIKEIWTGPSRMKWETKRAVEYLCWNHGYLSAESRATSAPFRVL
jgi:hypothetical protein